MDKLFEYISKEWTVVSQAPFAFMIIAAIVFGLAYIAAKWRFTAVIDQINASNEALKERLHLRSELAESYKDRALKYDDKVQQVVDFDEIALRDKTLEVVKDLRDFIDRTKREDDRNLMENRLSSSRSEEQRQADWEAMTNNMMRLGSERNAEYDRRFRVHAIMLRDELRSRLPGYKPQEDYFDSMYEHPTNYFGFDGVADDLERMARMLTSQASGAPKARR